MIQLIIGEKGKGKTKVLLDKANECIKEATGNVVYLDKSAKHMYEINNKVRLIDTSVYGIENSDQFIGFIYGIISQDHDLQVMFLDNFLSVASCDANFDAVISKLSAIGKEFNVDFVISMSKVEADLSAELKEMVIAAL